MTTEPSDAELAAACEIMAGDHQVMFFGWCALHGFGIQGWPEKAAHELRRHLKAMWDTAVGASRLERRPADAGTERNTMKVRAEVKFDDRTEIVEGDLPIYDTTSAAVRRAALEEVAKWCEAQEHTAVAKVGVASDKEAKAYCTARGDEARTIAAHCRRLAQQGGE